MPIEYNGLTRAYATVPVDAVQQIEASIETLYATVDVATSALKLYESCETKSVEIVLTRASHELDHLQQEVSTLLKHMEGGANDEQ